MKALTEDNLKKEFTKVINERGIHTKLGLPKQRVYDWRQKDFSNLRTMLYVLFLAQKLSIHEPTGEKN